MYTHLFLLTSLPEFSLHSKLILNALPFSLPFRVFTINILFPVFFSILTNICPLSLFSNNSHLRRNLQWYPLIALISLPLHILERRVYTSDLALAIWWNNPGALIGLECGLAIGSSSGFQVILLCKQRRQFLVYPCSINSTNTFTSGLWSLHFSKMSLANKLIHGLMTKFHEKFSGLLYGDLYFLLEPFLPLTSGHLIPIALTFTPFSQKFYVLNSLKWHHTSHSHPSSKPGYHCQHRAFGFHILSPTVATAPSLGAGRLPLLFLLTAWLRVWSLQPRLMEGFHN